MAQIELRSVSKAYRHQAPAVRALSLEVRDGELMALVGPSGSGKTTTLRLIAGLERATTGEIRIGGIVVNDTPPERRGIAMVFQNYALYPHLTVERNMAFGLPRTLPRAEIRERIMAAADVLRIADLLGRYPGELSGGERQRAALGKAMVRRPAAFLFDEPLSNLDARLRRSARGEIKALHRRLGTTTLHVTHDQEEALTLGDRIAVMHCGMLQQVGTPAEVYRAPANAFVAGFIGSPAMNFIPGSLQSRDGQIDFVESIDREGSVLPLRLPILPEHARAAADAAGRAIVLGFRPQALSESPGEGGSQIELTVRIAEPLGEAVDLICTAPSGRQIVARVAREYPPGQQLRLHINPASTFLFEPGEMGRNLLAPGSR
jgi:multiple sugar transport system ATP-binding protein